MAAGRSTKKNQKRIKEQERDNQDRLNILAGVHVVQGSSTTAQQHDKPGRCAVLTNTSIEQDLAVYCDQPRLANREPCSWAATHDREL